MIIKVEDSFIEKDTGEIIEPKFSNYTSVENYLENKVKSVVPMTAKEADREDELEKMYNSIDYFAEEKLDGTRATFHFTDNGIRIFSRRVSKKTGWFAENSDLLPHIRDWEFPKELIGTVIDGELFIPNKPFKDVSSTMNCNWDKALERQLELGFVHLKAFDIIYYKNIKITAMPLWRRKELLHEVLEKAKCPYIEEIKYFIDIIEVEITDLVMEDFQRIEPKFPILMREIYDNLDGFPSVGDMINISKKAYYEYIVCNGGEGIILKNVNGKYYHKRGREYTKVKKFLTREVIIIGYSEPTIEYEGKAPETWTYFEDKNTGEKYVIDYDTSIGMSIVNDESLDLKPVTKFDALDWIGTIQFGVIATDEEIESWEKRNKEKAKVVELEGKKLLYIGETSGITDELREEISNNRDSYIGKVIEIKAQEVIKKTGKMRHPRFLRFRNDKNLEDCIWKDHIV